MAIGDSFRNIRRILGPTLQYVNGKLDVSPDFVGGGGGGGGDVTQEEFDAAINGLDVRVDVLEDRRRRLDVRDFVTGSLTGSNICQAIEDARSEAYLLTSEAAGWAYDVYVPPGHYDIMDPADVLYFPGVSTAIPSPGLIGGDGERATNVVFRCYPGIDNFFLTIGDLDEDDSAFTARMRIAGFTVEGAGGAALGSGIDIRGSIHFRAENLIVKGFAGIQPWTSGYGIRITRTPSSTQPHQHPTFTNVMCDTNQINWELGNVAQGKLTNCHAHGGRFRNIVLNGASTFSWDSGEFQVGDASTQDAWYHVNVAHLVPNVTGWNIVVDSGSGAALSTVSAGLCTVTGLLGLDVENNDDRGCYLRLTDSTPASPDKVTGMYKIHAILSPTSCTIEKDTNHTAQTGLAWELRGAGGSYVLFEGSVYDESAKYATFGFYRSLSTDGHYTVRDATVFNGQFSVAADMCGEVSLYNILGSGPVLHGRKLTRVYSPNAFPVLDDWSRNSAQFLAADGSGLVDSRGGRSHRMRQLCKELGAIEIWDARLTGALSLAGADVQSWTGSGGTVLTPHSAGVYPQYNAADAEFDGPVIEFPGGAGAVAALSGSISSSLIPQDMPRASSVVLVLRTGSASASTGPNGMSLYDGVNLQTIIDVHDQNAANAGVHFSTAVYTPVTGTLRIPFTGAVDDQEPHCIVHGGQVRNRSRSRIDLANDLYTDGAGGETIAHALGTNWELSLGRNFSGTNQPWFVAFIAVIPRSLTSHETQQIIDCARNEWPLTP